MDAPAHFDIDGVSPREIERPLSVDDVTRTLRQASADGSAVAPVGGGGALHIGNPIERYDIALDMRGLDRILEHQEADLVLSVEAGACLADISERLARHGQWLPIEAPHPSRATVGGLIATALSGPGRLGHGSLRDYLIGISFVTPTGGLAKAGGMVVKNVSGFDLMRLHHGALGTLGVVVSANFKVLPAPRGQASVILGVTDLDDARRTIDIVDRCGGHPSALEIGTGPDGTSTVATRFDGLPGQVDAAASALAKRIGGTACVLTDDESRKWWRAAVNRLAQPSDEVGELRLGVRPSDAMTLATAIKRSANAHDISIESLTIWPTLGTIIVRLDIDDAPGRSATALDAIVGLTEASGATWWLTSVPVSLETGRDVWGAAPASLQTMRRLKDQFDPGRVLNPGRFCGSI